jgi:hypothetical protein
MQVPHLVTTRGLHRPSQKSRWAARVIRAARLATKQIAAARQGLAERSLLRGKTAQITVRPAFAAILRHGRGRNNPRSAGCLNVRAWPRTICKSPGG